jgi:hypothetical protein
LKKDVIEPWQTALTGERVLLTRKAFDHLVRQSIDLKDDNPGRLALNSESETQHE